MKNKLHLVQKTARLTCTWKATGNPILPLACVWVAAGTPSAVSDTTDSSEEAGLCLCA
jgi:hypothetical protein